MVITKLLVVGGTYAIFDVLPELLFLFIFHLLLRFTIIHIAILIPEGNDVRLIEIGE